jgi:hypothetical protein
MSMHPSIERRLKRLRAMGAAPANGDPPQRWPLRSIIGAVVFAVIGAPFLALAALLLLTVVWWTMTMAVFFSLTLGLMFLAWAFG